MYANWKLPWYISMKNFYATHQQIVFLFLFLPLSWLYFILRHKNGYPLKWWTRSGMLLKNNTLINFHKMQDNKDGEIIDTLTNKTTTVNFSVDPLALVVWELWHSPVIGIHRQGWAAWKPEASHSLQIQWIRIKLLQRSLNVQITDQAEPQTSSSHHQNVIC